MLSSLASKYYLGPTKLESADKMAKGALTIKKKILISNSQTKSTNNGQHTRQEFANSN